MNGSLLHELNVVDRKSRGKFLVSFLSHDKMCAYVCVDTYVYVCVSVVGN